MFIYYIWLTINIVSLTATAKIAVCMHVLFGFFLKSENDKSTKNYNKNTKFTTKATNSKIIMRLGNNASTYILK